MPSSRLRCTDIGLDDTSLRLQITKLQAVSVAFGNQIDWREHAAYFYLQTVDDRDSEIEHLKVTLRRVRDTLQTVSGHFSLVTPLQTIASRIIHPIRVVGKVVMKTSAGTLFDHHQRENDRYRLPMPRQRCLPMWKHWRGSVARWPIVWPTFSNCWSPAMIK